MLRRVAVVHIDRFAGIRDTGDFHPEFSRGSVTAVRFYPIIKRRRIIVIVESGVVAIDLHFSGCI